MVLRVVPVDSMLSCNNNVTSASYNTKSNSYRILMSYSTHDALHWNVALVSPNYVFKCMLLLYVRFISIKHPSAMHIGLWVGVDVAWGWWFKPV